MRSGALCFFDGRFPSCPGSMFHYDRSPVIREDGTFYLKISGKVNIKDSINAQVPLTDIKLLLQRIVAGDATAYTPGVYGDFTHVPTTMCDCLNLVNTGRKTFDSLPVDVKAKFDNDFQRWFASAGTSDWYTKMGMLNNPTPAPYPVSDSSPVSE